MPEIDISFKVKIEHEEHPESPREDGACVGKMVCFHSRYTLGDKHDYRQENYKDWDEMEAAIRKEEDGVLEILPVYMLDHSGVALNTTGFSCPWDSGRVGLIFTTRQLVKEMLGAARITKDVRERIRKALKAEIEEYGNYINGDVYCYTVEDAEGEHVDSCGGFYDRTHCLEEAKEAAASHVKELIEI